MIDERQFTHFLNRTEIDGLVQGIAEKIRKDYSGKPLVLVGVLKGAVLFMSDLFRAIGRDDVEIDFVRMSSHGKGPGSFGTVTLLKDLGLDIRGKNVLIVEEIIDSGRSLQFLYDRIKMAEPTSVEVVTLLDKSFKRLVKVPVKYVGKVVEDQFLVGYGLDLEEKNRNLKEIYYLRYPN